MSAAANSNGKQWSAAHEIEAWRPSFNPWIIALVVTLATFMEVLDTSIANVALPHIAGSLSAGEDESTWVLTSYLVANAIILPLNGWFSALLGRKRFYMICVAIFTLSSAACGFAPNLGVLVLCRILQGLGGGGLQPTEQAILADTFPREKRSMGMAVYGVAVVTAPIIGPTLGGWITDNYSWRWVFLINVPVGILSLVLSSRLVEDPPFLRRKTFKDGLKIDYIGLGLLTIGLGFLQYVLDKGQREDWFQSNLILLMTVISAGALIGAVLWELHTDEPVIDLHLLRDKNFAISCVLMFMLGFTLYGSTALLPLFMQKMLGYTATRSGMAISPGGLITMFMFPIIGMLVQKIDARRIAMMGFIMVSASLFIMAGFNLQIDFGTAVMARCVQASGLAMLFLPINTMAFSFLPRTKNNAASGLINLARNQGGGFGIAFVTTMLARRAQFHQNVLSSHITPYDGQTQAMLHNMTQNFIAHGSDAVQASQQAHGTLYGLLGRESVMLAYIDDFWIMAVALLFMIPLLFLMKRARPVKGEMAAH